MPGGLLGGGSAPAGNTTTTTTNPTQQAQLPFLQGGWQAAADQARGAPYQYYPGQTLAPNNPNVAAGYQGQVNTGYTNFDTANAGTNAFRNAVGGGTSVNNSPAMPILGSVINGGESPFRQIGALTNLGQSAGYANTGTDQLAATARGDYLNSNPYLDKTFGSASDAVRRAYQTTTAPQTDSHFANSGRYGSGAMMNARDQNQRSLGTTLDNLATQIYGGNYATERGLQTNAAGTYGGLVNQENTIGQAGYGAAGQLLLGDVASKLSAGNTLQTGYDAGNSNALKGLLLEPQVLAGANTPNQQITAGGQGLTALDQQQISDLMARFYGTQDAPWTNISKYLNAVGQPTTGSSSKVEPYYSNPTANVLGAATGGLGLYNGLNTATGGGLAGLFGLGGGAESATAALTGGGGLYAGLGGAGAAGAGAAAGAGGIDAAIASVLSAFTLSDRRLKTDIERVGKLDNGLPVYSYRFHGQRATQIGLMADEVEQVHPAAVHTMPNGFKAVDYGLAVRAA